MKTGFYGSYRFASALNYIEMTIKLLEISANVFAIPWPSIMGLVQDSFSSLDVSNVRSSIWKIAKVTLKKLDVPRVRSLTSSLDTLPRRDQPHV